MCMLFAVSSKDSFELNNYLDSFFKNSKNHPHGWGMAFLRSGKTIIKKEPTEASKSNELSKLLKKTIRSTLALAHIRYATIGNVDAANCHPFSETDSLHKRWTLIHNGTIFDYPPLSKCIKRQKGETDSERILLYFIHQIKKSNSSSFIEFFNLFDSIIPDMSKGNKLNLIFTDGEYLYVHTNCRDTLFYLEKNETIVFSTAPITGENWKKVPFCTLLVYKDGKLMKTGTTHVNEYIENIENTKLLYRIFSNL